MPLRLESSTSKVCSKLVVFVACFALFDLYCWLINLLLTLFVSGQVLIRHESRQRYILNIPHMGVKSKMAIGFYI